MLQECGGKLNPKVEIHFNLYKKNKQAKPPQAARRTLLQLCYYSNHFITAKLFTRSPARELLLCSGGARVCNRGWQQGGNTSHPSKGGSIHFGEQGLVTVFISPSWWCGSADQGVQRERSRKMTGDVLPSRKVALMTTLIVLVVPTFCRLPCALCLQKSNRLSSQNAQSRSFALESPFISFLASQG